jgi:hypothetical protein
MRERGKRVGWGEESLGNGFLSSKPDCEILKTTLSREALTGQDMTANFFPASHLQKQAGQELGVSCHCWSWCQDLLCKNGTAWYQCGCCLLTQALGPAHVEYPVPPWSASSPQRASTGL